MGAINFDDVYADAYVRKSVEVAAEQLVRQFPALSIFQDDIRQELWIYIARAVEKYDPERGCSLQTFFRNVIDVRTIDICRRYLNQDARNLHFGDTNLDDEYPVYAREDFRLILLRMDLAVVMQRLSPAQRQVCQWIMDGLSLRTIARKLGVSDSTFFFLYIRPIRDEFRKEKMEEYLNFY